MTKTFITSCCLFAIMACGTAFAQQEKLASGPYKGPMAPMVSPDMPDVGPFYTNLVVNPCTACNYSADNGFFVLGPNNCFAPGSTQWISYPFVATKTGNVRMYNSRSRIPVSAQPLRPSLRLLSITIMVLALGPGTQIGNAVVATPLLHPVCWRTPISVTRLFLLPWELIYWVVVTT